MARQLPPPDQAQKKWANRLSAATQDIQLGVDRVTEAPGQAAVKQFDAWLAGVQASAEKWRRKTAAVSLEDWRSAMKNIGIPRVAQGAQQKQDKWGRHYAAFMPHLQSGMDKIRSMPKVTRAQRIQRAVAMMEWSAEWKGGS